MNSKRLRFAATLVCFFTLLVPLVRLATDWRTPRSPVQTVSIESSPGPASATTAPPPPPLPAALENSPPPKPAPPVAPALINEARVRELLRREFDGLSETRRPDGGYSLALHGRFRHLATAVHGTGPAALARCYCVADDVLHAHSSAGPIRHSQ
jgi:hypothetical protein